MVEGLKQVSFFWEKGNYIMSAALRKCWNIYRCAKAKEESLSNRDSKRLSSDSASIMNSSLHQKENRSIQLNLICWIELALSSFFLSLETIYLMYVVIVFHYNVLLLLFLHLFQQYSGSEASELEQELRYLWLKMTSISDGSHIAPFGGK